MACGERVATNSKRTNKEMNRVIKFRGKRLDNGEWCYGYYTYCNDTHTIQWVNEDGAPWWADVDPATVGQYTGLSDCNGKELYEGDVIAIRVNPCEVKWNDSISAFCVRFYFEKQVGIRTIGTWLSEEPTSIILGNIHDNPELLIPNK